MLLVLTMTEKYSALKINLLLFFFFKGILLIAQKECTFSPNSIVPSENQLNYQQMEVIGFIHFTITTFYDKEWGYGDENPNRFNPLLLNVEQWVKTAKDGGIKELILTAKHHDGFCLWPSIFTEHSIKSSPYKNGQGDLVREFVNACRKYNIKVGLYLSPWDRNHKDYGKSEYIAYYKNQLNELLTNYGEINEIWFDGANGGDGYYGGAREKRVIGDDYYPWEEIFTTVRTLQPNCMIFSDAGPDIRWVGNENGHCGDTFWSTIDKTKLKIGRTDTKYLNTGEPSGNKWIVGECDVSIRPGWFFHSSEDAKVKSSAKIVDLYYQAVGKNGVLLVNIPPDSVGLINKTDSTNLLGFKNIIEETFKNNLIKGSIVSASSCLSDDKCFAASNIVDESNDSFWAAKEGTSSALIEIEIKNPVTFNRFLIQEPIRFGQRISEFEISAFINNEWKVLSSASTVGYKRLLQFETTTSNKIRINIKNSISTPAISNLGLYLGL